MSQRPLARTRVALSLPPCPPAAASSLSRPSKVCGQSECSTWIEPPLVRGMGPWACSLRKQGSCGSSFRSKGGGFISLPRAPPATTALNQMVVILSADQGLRGSNEKFRRRKWWRACILLPRLSIMLGLIAVRGHEGGGQGFSEHGTYALFMFPPPEMCFPDSTAVYVASAISDGLFADPRVRRDGIRLQLRINGMEFAAAEWDSSSDLEADEGLSHHFSIPGLPDGEYDAELAILLGAAGDVEVGLPASTTFRIDQGGECATGVADELPVSPGKSADGTGATGHEKVLVNVALGKRAWMSSVAAGSHASYATDGVTMVTSLVQHNALTDASPSGSPLLPNERQLTDAHMHPVRSDGLGASCQKGAACGKGDEEIFWEVDLGQSHQIHLVDIWGGRQAAAPGAYPPIIPLSASLLPLDLCLMAPDWSPVATWRFGSNDTHDGGEESFSRCAGGNSVGEGVEGSDILSWRVGQGAGGEQSAQAQEVWARYLRVSVPAPSCQDGVLGGETQRQPSWRQLALLEVAVFAWEPWNCTHHCEDRGRGRCAPSEPHRSSGPCECAPDRVGLDCSAHLLTDFAFLPPDLSPLADAHADAQEWRERVAGRWQEQVLQQAVSQVEEAQRGGSCSSPDSMVVGYHPGGMAASLSLISSILAMTLSLNRTMLLWRKSEWFYADPQECPDRQMSCFFEPWHRCQAHHIDSFLEGAFHIKIEESATTRGVQPFAWVPPAHKDKGIFWWRTVLNRFLFRLDPKLKTELDVDGAMQELGLLHERYIGVHVRLGDSCVKWQELFQGQCISVSQHIVHARFMAWRYGIRRVFVASDDPSVPDQFVLALPELTIVSADTISRYRGVLHDMEQSKSEWTENRLRLGKISRGELLRSTLLDVELLARAAVFVGHLASNLSRLAYSLAVGRSAGLVPFISVDGPWCYHWQLCCDVDESGRSNMCS